MPLTLELREEYTNQAGLDALDVLHTGAQRNSRNQVSRGVQVSSCDRLVVHSQTDERNAMPRAKKKETDHIINPKADGRNLWGGSQGQTSARQRPTNSRSLASC